MKRSLILWILAMLITVGSAVYQRTTGPTLELDGRASIGHLELYYSLPRSYETTENCPVVLVSPDASLTGELTYRRYRSHDNWTVQPMVRHGDSLVAEIPKQPAAGKIMYRLTARDSTGNATTFPDEPVLIRFVGPVPAVVLIAHVFFMFTAMLLSTRTGLQGLVGSRKLFGLALTTSVCLFIGGIILGPVVQKFAFGAYWTGWPLGNDLTDNKTAVAMLAWLVALWRSRRSNGPIWAVAAAVVTLAVYLIPHSLLGSELDYTEMENTEMSTSGIAVLLGSMTGFMPTTTRQRRL